MVSGGVREEERKARQCGGGAPTGVPGPHSAGAQFKLSFKPIQKYSNSLNEIQIPPNFDWFKRYIPALKKFEIKYGWKEFELRINFPYRNFSRFEMEFEVKFREFMWVELN
jgi:hypothetical protein